MPKLAERFTDIQIRNLKPSVAGKLFKKAVGIGIHGQVEYNFTELFKDIYVVNQKIAIFCNCTSHIGSPKWLQGRDSLRKNSSFSLPRECNGSDLSGNYVRKRTGCY